MIDVRIVQGLGHGLDESAVAAAKRWKFNPATRCGKASRVEVCRHHAVPARRLMVRQNLAIAALGALAILSSAPAGVRADRAHPTRRRPVNRS